MVCAFENYRFAVVKKHKDYKQAWHGQLMSMENLINGLQFMLILDAVNAFSCQSEFGLD